MDWVLGRKFALEDTKSMLLCDRKMEKCNESVFYGDWSFSKIKKKKKAFIFLEQEGKNLSLVKHPSDIFQNVIKSFLFI